MLVESSLRAVPLSTYYPRSIIFGILYYVFYQFCLTIDTTIVFDLGHAMTLSQLTFIRGSGCLLVLIFLCGRQIANSFKTRFLKLNIARSLLTLAAIWFIYFGLQHLSLSDALVIIYLRPLFVVTMGVLILREKLTFRKTLAVAAGFVGTVIAVGPSLVYRDRAYLGAVLVAALGALFGAAATITTKTSTQTNTDETVLAFMSIVFFSASPFALVQVWPWSRLQELSLLAISGGLAVWFNTKALRHAEASLLGPIEYLRLPLGLSLAFICFSEKPSAWTIFGSALIVVSCLPLLPNRLTWLSNGRLETDL